MHLLISKTFDVVTHESAEDGEAAESGFVYENEPFTFRELVREIESGGFYREGGTRWLTSHAEEDYRTGEVQTEHLHFSHLNPPHLEKWFQLAVKWAAKR